jgi:hypothetical protein
MQEQEEKFPAEMMQLAKMLGARQAFGIVAGHCSASHAMILRDIRDNKKYLALSRNFDEFCADHLHVTRRTVDRIIGLLNEFGPGYFALAQLTGIGADEFRALAPAMKDNCLEHGGEAIALVEENAAKLAAALDALRQSAPVKEREAHRRTSFQRIWKRFAGELKAVTRAASADDRDIEYLLILIRADLAEIEVEWGEACKARPPRLLAI